MTFPGSITEIPDELIFAHEDGNVVFFCGAGISKDAGLPLFKELFENVRSKLKIALSHEENILVENRQFDQAFQLLERKMEGSERGILKIREVVARQLQVGGNKAIPRNGLSKHKAVLNLARTRDNKLHLVTTNYDLLFDRAARQIGLGKLSEFNAPLLPVLKPYHWDGIVYLHGKLGEHASTDSQLESLVLTSGDFGNAYLVDRWASRFVADLFKNFTVCFIGYSADDAVMRYMMDAVASEKRRGQTPRKVYAFDICDLSQESRKRAQWMAKEIELIPYRPDAKGGHSELRRTLVSWATTYSNFVSGKSSIVVQEMSKLPDTVSTAGKAAIGRVLWALSEQSGVPAKTLASMTIPPSLDWIYPMTEIVLHKEWLPKFGVATLDENWDEPMRLISHPPALKNSPFLGVMPSSINGKLDAPNECILTWLLKHVQEWNLLYWFASFEDAPTQCVRERLWHTILTCQWNDKELRDMWMFYLSSCEGLLDPIEKHRAVYNWLEGLKASSGEITCGLRDRFVTLIRPVVRVSDNYSIRPYPGKRHASWRISLNALCVSSAIFGETNLNVREILAQLYEEIKSALKRLCEIKDLVCTLEGGDYSYFSLPTIEESEQARDSDDWAALAKLMRESWLGILEKHPDRAVREAKQWQKSEYKIFQRFYLWAASECKAIRVRSVIDFLADERGLLFDKLLRHEILRFIDLRGAEFNRRNVERILRCLNADNKRGENQEYVRAIFLDHLRDAGIELTRDANIFLEGVDNKHSRWRQRRKDRDGLLFYISDDEDDSSENESHGIPEELTKEFPSDYSKQQAWLERYESLDSSIPVEKDGWRKYCAAQPSQCAEVLLSFGRKNGYWPDKAWHIAFECWQYGDRATQAWSAFDAEIVKILPTELMVRNINRIVFWLREVSKVENVGYSVLDFCLCILEEPRFIEDKTCSPNTAYCAIATEAILRTWYNSKPKRGEGLKDPYSEIFTKIARAENTQYNVARSEILHHITDFYVVDPNWTTEMLLPLLSWKQDSEIAKESWEEALMMPRYDTAFMKVVKPDFLKVAEHITEIKEFSCNWYASLIFSMAFYRIDGYTSSEFTNVIKVVDEKTRDEIVRRFYLTFADATSNQDDIWQKYGVVFLDKVFPEEPRFMSGRSSQLLMELVTTLDEKFPEAVKRILPIISGNIHFDLAMDRLWDEKKHRLTLCMKYPKESLDYLSRISYGFALGGSLSSALSQIVEACPKLGLTNAYKNLQLEAERISY